MRRLLFLSYVPGRWWRSDRGSYALETAILAPVFIIGLIGLLTFAGRTYLADGAADSAAHAAAREASLQRTAGRAQQEAREAAKQSLQQSGLTCLSTEVSIDASGLSAPAGQAATVTADVSCTVSFADLGLPGIPGAKTLRSSFTSVVDQYRARDLGFTPSEAAAGPPGGDA